MRLPAGRQRWPRRARLAALVTFGILQAGAGLRPASAGAVQAASNREAPRDRPQATEGFVTADDGVRLFYRKIGDGPQSVILPGSLFLFDFFRQLTSPGRTLVFYDMRNRGRSDAVSDTASINLRNDVTDLEAVRRHFGVEKASLVGYSYLGMMVVLYTLEHPGRVARVVQLGPVPLAFGTEYPERLTATDDPVDPALEAELSRLREEGYAESHPAEYCRKVWTAQRGRLVGDPANAAKLGDGPCDMPNEWPVNLARHFQHHFTSVQQLDVSWKDASRVEVPVLTIHGTRDRNAPYGAGREWALRLPQGRLLTVAGAAHQSWIDAPDVVLSAVRVFLDGEWPAAAERVTALEPGSAPSP